MLQAPPGERLEEGAVVGELPEHDRFVLRELVAMSMGLHVDSGRDQLLDLLGGHQIEQAVASHSIVVDLQALGEGPREREALVFGAAGLAVLDDVGEGAGLRDGIRQADGPAVGRPRSARSSVDLAVFQNMYSTSSPNTGARWAT